MNTERRFTMTLATYIPALVAADSDGVGGGRGFWTNLRAASPTLAA